ncbi:hypothetical protein BGZ60DRAFT_418659 [Tricladium varicosporioides]|nr:hypothetical protein BGZ60DRAFT_418659 [Hymenoscyphus varicosporioides]
MSITLQGKVALITGGAKNLGAGIATEFARLGSNLALHYHSSGSKSPADALLSTLTSSYPNIKIVFYQANLTTAAAVEKLFEDVVKDFGKVDVLVNTVGMVLKKPLGEISEEEFDVMNATNSKSAFLLLRSASQHITDNGSIITIATSLLAAYTGLYTSYAGTKAGVEHFTRGLSKELMGKGINVNVVAPGPMDTPFFYAQESPEAVAYHKSNAMGGRLTDVSDIVPIVRFLVTEGRWINGQTLFANGGYTTR